MQSKIVFICTGLLILLFTYTGVFKLVSHFDFYQDLRNQPIFKRFAIFLSWAVPLLELLLVALLCSKRTMRTGFLLSYILMLAFTIYTAIILLGVLGKRPCSCGGIIRQMNWQEHFLFNLGFTIIALLGFWLSKKNDSPIPFKDIMYMQGKPKT